MADFNDPNRSRKQRSQPQQNVPSQIEPRMSEPDLYSTEMILDNAASGYMATAPDLMYDNMYGGQAAYYMGVAESDKPGSSTDAMSFVNVGPATSIITNSTSSYVMVHKKRAGSNESSGTSAEGSENQMYSVPPSTGSSEWHHGGEFAVDMDTTEDDSFQAMAPHDPKVILSTMYSPGNDCSYPVIVHLLISLEPKPIHNPYSPEATVSTNGESPTAQEYMENYTTSSVNQTRPLSLTSRPSDEAPWTHMEPYRVPRYEPGYTAFAPSPGPAAEQDHEELRPSVSMSRGNSKGHGSRPAKSTLKGKERAKPNGWEHAVVQKGGLQLIMNPDEQTSQRGGCRKGKLDPEAAEKARKIRRLTACWNCWIQKVPVHILEPLHVICKLTFDSAPKGNPAIDAGSNFRQQQTSCAADPISKNMSPLYSQVGTFWISIWIPY